jgi:hypothetical protein
MPFPQRGGSAPRRSPSCHTPNPGRTRSVPTPFASTGRTDPPGSGSLSAVPHARQRGCSLMLALRKYLKPTCAHGT